MFSLDIVKNLAVNISFLVLTAYLLTKLSMVKDLMVNSRSRKGQQLFLILVFGFLGIACTYAGVPVEGAIANTRVIGVVAGGLIGGPVVGIGAGIIAGGHRYLIDIGGFTAAACAVSSILEGAIGGYFQKKYQTSPKKWVMAFSVTVVAEICQMATILLMAKPFANALLLVKVIGIPMILFNSIGVAIFLGVFSSVFASLDMEAARRTTIALEVVDDCLPFMRKGLADRESMRKTVEAIRKIPGIKDAIISGLPAEEALHCREMEKLLSDDTITVVSAPLTMASASVGSLILFVRNYGISQETEKSLVQGMAKLFSTQLELSKLDQQAKLLEQAEFRALQAQINPHFLFNCLSTISAVCSEKPERARELLVLLGDYFRRTLHNADSFIALQAEMEYVGAYLQLEQARFEEKLQVHIDVPDTLDCQVPAFILQPIVENAVKHGIMKGGRGGTVRIQAQTAKSGTQITVSDDGVGMEPALIDDLYHGRMNPKRIGLMNVHSRLTSLYGEAHGLHITAEKGKGTAVTMWIPDQEGENQCT